MDNYHYFLHSSLAYRDIDASILENFIKSIILDPKYITVEQKNILLNRCKNEILEDNYKLLLLWYSLSPKTKLQRRVFVETHYASYSEQINENILILKLFYPELKEYIKNFKIIFNDKFYQKDTNTKKGLLFFFYILPAAIYPIGKQYDLYFKVLYKIYKKLLEYKDEELILFIYGYMKISHTNMTQNEFKYFNKKVENKFGKFIKKELIPKYNLQANNRKIDNTKKIKVAFIIERAIMHSINKVLISLLEILAKEDNSKYEFIILNIEHKEFSSGKTTVANRFASIGCEYIDLHKQTNSLDNIYYNQIEKILKVREYIIESKIDILIVQGGLHLTEHFLFASRSCPKQIYWSHGNCSYSIKGIDKRFSHYIQECQDNYEWNICDIPLNKELLVGSKDDKIYSKLLKKRLLNKYGRDTIILGTIGRLIKIDKSHIKVVQKIMQKYSNSIYLVCGIGDQNRIKSILNEYKIDESRWIFTGEINPHVYGWIIDFYLGPLDGTSGQSLDEYRYKYKSYVSLHNSKWRKIMDEDFKQNPNKYILRKLYNKKQLKSALSQSPFLKENKSSYTFIDYVHPLNSDDYLKIVLRLLGDIKLRKKIIKEYKYISTRHNQYLFRNTTSSFMKVIND